MRMNTPTTDHMKLVHVFRLGFALSLLVAMVARAAESSVAAALRADHARLAAMMAGDGAALGRLMSDELRFVHSDGRVEAKAD